MVYYGRKASSVKTKEGTLWKGGSCEVTRMQTPTTSGCRQKTRSTGTRNSYNFNIKFRAYEYMQRVKITISLYIVLVIIVVFIFMPFSYPCCWAMPWQLLLLLILWIFHDIYVTLVVNTIPSANVFLFGTSCSYMYISI